jgi:ribokinase
MNLRLSRLPRPGETLLGGEFFNAPGGKGANQAVAASRAGGQVTFLTAFGDDDISRSIRKHDEAEGIDLRHAKTVAGASTGVALIMVGENGENLIGVAMGANGHLDQAYIDELPDDVFTQGGVLLVSLEVPIEVSAAAIRRAHRGGMKVVVNPAPADPKLRELGLLPMIDVLTPNESEAEVLAGPGGSAESLLIQGVKSLVITLGGNGCLVLTKESRIAIPAVRVEVIDTVGAGDAFNAALAVGIAEGRSLEGASRWASAAAAIAVTKPGAQGALPTRAEIDHLAQNQP